MDRKKTSPDPWNHEAFPMLTHQGSSFIGRISEIDTLSRMLLHDGVRLVTLTGPGGIGKTRLAMRIASNLHPVFSDGARCVSLETVFDETLVPSAIVRGLGLQPAGEPEPSSYLASVLADKELLLVLDNFEQVLGASPIVSFLLSRCPGLRVVATSRAPLEVTGERIFPLPPLALASQGDPLGAKRLATIESIQLFLDRATAVDPEFVLGAENASQVAEICRRLDGLPLAIELAAAQIRLLTPQMILDRVRGNQSLPLPGPRDAPDRLRSVQNAISWSYDLLTPSEQSLFRCLSVFIGGFDLEAAEAICGGALPMESRGDILPSLGALVTHSLVMQREVRGEGRYGMLESIRMFGFDRLVERRERDAVRGAHARRYLALAEQRRWAWLTSTEDLARLDSEHSNLIAALEYFREHADAGSLLRMTTSLSGFWYVHSYLHTARMWLDYALALEPRDHGSLRGRALVSRGMMLATQGHPEEAESLLTQGMGMLEGSGETAMMSVIHLWYGGVANFAGDHDEAEQRLAMALELALGISDPVISASLAARALSNLGVAASGRGEHGAAMERHEASFRLCEKHGLVLGMVRTLYDRGEVASDQGDFERSMGFFRACLDLQGSDGDRRLLADILERSALAATSWGQAKQAARFLGAADELRRQFGNPGRSVADRTFRELTLEAIGTELRAATIAREVARGKALRLDAIIRDILALAPGQPSAKPQEKDSRSLSERELEVLEMVASGSSNREIASALYLSVRTVEAHVARIRQKLEVNSRTAAVAVAIAEGLVAPESTTAPEE